MRNGGSDRTQTRGLRRDSAMFKGNTAGFLRVLEDANCHKLLWAAVKAYPNCIQLCVFFFSVHLIADLTADTKHGFFNH